MVIQSHPFSRLHRWVSPSRADVRITTRSPTNRALAAITDVPANATVLTIPTTNTITTGEALGDATIRRIITTHPPPSPTKRESAALLLQVVLLSNSERYKPWFNVLPEVVVTATSARSTLCLMNTPLQAVSELLRKELDELYSEWFIAITESYPQLFPPVLRSKTAFMRAHTIIESRAFQFGDETAIAPYLDFCNHSTRPNAKVSMHGGLIHLITTRDISSDEEITISYGDLSNQDLLLHWGFALPNNPHDRIMLSLEHQQNVSKMIILAVHVPALEFSLSAQDPLPTELVKAARIFSCDDDETVGGVKKHFGKSVSAGCERRAVEFLREIVHSFRIDQGDCGDDAEEGTSEDEKQFIKSCRVYKNGCNAILDRTSEKIDDMENAIA